VSAYLSFLLCLRHIVILISLLLFLLFGYIIIVDEVELPNVFGHYRGLLWQVHLFDPGKELVLHVVEWGHSRVVSDHLNEVLFRLIRDRLNDELIHDFDCVRLHSGAQALWRCQSGGRQYDTR